MHVSEEFQVKEEGAIGIDGHCDISLVTQTTTSATCPDRPFLMQKGSNMMEQGWEWKTETQL